MVCSDLPHRLISFVRTIMIKIKYTNKLNLPKPIVEAIINDPYNSGDSDFTVTQLIAPAKASVIAKQSNETIEQDVSESIDSLDGQVIHSLLERAGAPLREQGFLVEERLYMTVFVDGKGYKVSAQLDLYNPQTGMVSDYKRTKTSAFKHGLKEEHKMQVNVQALLLRKNGHDVKRGEIVVLYKDWTPMIEYDGYPPAPANRYEVELLDDSTVISWIGDRIRANLEAENELPQCTDKERWAYKTYAIMKPDAKKAYRVFDKREDAVACLKEQKPDSGYILKERIGESIRCKFYCPVRSICEQRNKEFPAPALGEDGMFKL